MFLLPKLICLTLSCCCLLSVCHAKVEIIEANFGVADKYTYNADAAFHSYLDNDGSLIHFVVKRDISLDSSLLTNNNSHANVSNAYEPVSTTPVPPNSQNGSALNTSPTFDSDSRNEEKEKYDNYNTTNTKFDHHRYYKSYSKTGVDEVLHYWVNLDELPKEKVIAHDSLSSSHRRALTVALSFDFPFYGHVLQNVTIATGGFLFTGSFLHKWLAATQYIAPLMANFDTSISPEATVRYVDNGTSMTVQWEKVVLQDNPQAGPFTFQVTIHQSGEIVFAYKDIPVIVTLIGDVEHPVKVGLSDAYIVEKTIFYIRKKTIYEYHKIDMKKGIRIANWTAVVFEPIPNCVNFKACESCITSDTSFECQWCPEVGRCSDGLDRHRQDWLEGGCDQTAVSKAALCHLLPAPKASVTPLEMHSRAKESGSSRKSVFLALLIVFTITLFVGGWVAYAYLHPHSPSGQILIKYRPSAWSWRRGEARYTAASMHSIHM